MNKTTKIEPELTIDISKPARLLRGFRRSFEIGYPHIQCEVCGGWYPVIDSYHRGRSTIIWPPKCPYCHHLNEEVNELLDEGVAYLKALAEELEKARDSDNFEETQAVFSSFKKLFVD